MGGGVLGVPCARAGSAWARRGGQAGRRCRRALLVVVVPLVPRVPLLLLVLGLGRVPALVAVERVRLWGLRQQEGVRAGSARSEDGPARGGTWAASASWPGTAGSSPGAGGASPPAGCWCQAPWGA